jgi:hypothetical protein
MNTFRPWRSVLATVMLTLLVTGCGKKTAQNTEPEPAPAQGPVQSFVGGPSAPAQGAARRGMEIQKAKQHLNSIKQLTAVFKTDRGKGPANLKDFTDYMQRDDPTLAKLLQDGVIVMVFKPNLAPEALLAYVGFEDGAGNRAVLRENGMVEVLNREGFAEAQKK